METIILGLGELYDAYVGILTAEGENYLLTQQTTRYLLKGLQMVQSGAKLTGNSKYIENYERLLNEKSSVTSMDQFLNQDVQFHALAHRNIRLLVTMAEK